MTEIITTEPALSGLEKLEGILQELTQGVFSEESWNESDFYKIPEITYSYNFDKDEVNPPHIVNDTLFVKLGGMDMKAFNEASLTEKKTLIDEASKKVLADVESKKHVITSALNAMQSIATGEKVLLAKKVINEGGLIEVLNQLELLVEGIDFEKEKALVGNYFAYEGKSVDYIMSDKERNKKKLKIGVINTNIFGNALSDTVEYRKGILDHFHTKYDDYKERCKNNKIEMAVHMSTEERERYEGYLAGFGELDKNYSPKRKELPKRVTDEKWDKIDMSGTDIVQHFNYQYGANDAQTGGMNHVAQFNDKITGYSDTPRGLDVPIDSVRTVSNLLKILHLDIHENDQHGVTLERHKILVGNIRGAGNLELAEGTATLGEDLFKYGENLFKTAQDENGKDEKIIDVEKLGYLGNFPKTFAEENLTDEDFLDFLYLHNKVEPDNISPLARYLRHKRTGFQRKDVTYTQGKIKAAHYYNDIILGKTHNKFSDLFEGKVGFEEIDQFKIIRDAKLNKNLNIDEEISNNQKRINQIIKSNTGEARKIKKIEVANQALKKQKILLPENLMFHEAVYFSLKQREKKRGMKIGFSDNKKEGRTAIQDKGLDVNAEFFYKYLQKKYPGFYFSNDKIKSITYGFKKQLLGAVLGIENALLNHSSGKTTNENNMLQGKIQNSTLN